MNNPGFANVPSSGRQLLGAGATPSEIADRRKYIEAVTVPSALQVAKTLFYGSSAFDPRILGLSAIAILYGYIPSLGITKLGPVTAWLKAVTSGENYLSDNFTKYAFGARDAARASDLMIASFILYPLIVNQAPMSAILSLDYLTNSQNLIMGLSGVVLAALGVVVADYVMKATDKSNNVVPNPLPPSSNVLG